MYNNDFISIIFNSESFEKQISKIFTNNWQNLFLLSIFFFTDFYYYNYYFIFLNTKSLDSEENFQNYT